MKPNMSQEEYRDWLHDQPAGRQCPEAGGEEHPDVDELRATITALTKENEDLKREAMIVAAMLLGAEITELRRKNAALTAQCDKLLEVFGQLLNEAKDIIVTSIAGETSETIYWRCQLCGTSGFISKELLKDRDIPEVIKHAADCPWVLAKAAIAEVERGEK